MIRDITECIFVEHELETAHTIFIPRSCFPESSFQAAKWWSKEYAKYLLLAGKYSVLADDFSLPDEVIKQYPDPYETE